MSCACHTVLWFLSLRKVKSSASSDRSVYVLNVGIEYVLGVGIERRRPVEHRLRRKVSWPLSLLLFKLAARKMVNDVHSFCCFAGWYLSLEYRSAKQQNIRTSLPYSLRQALNKSGFNGEVTFASVGARQMINAHYQRRAGWTNDWRSANKEWHHVVRVSQRSLFFAPYKLNSSASSDRSAMLGVGIEHRRPVEHRRSRKRVRH